MGDKEKQKVIDLSTETSTVTQEELTPWQKENLKYLEQQGETPSWQPTMVANDKVAEPNGETKKAEKSETSAEEPAKIKELPKSKSFADKLPKMKQERKKRLTKRLTIIISIFGIAAMLMIYYVSPLSRIDKVEVVGNQVVTKNEIATSAGFKKEKLYWQNFFDRKTANAIKKANPRIKTVKKSISHFNNIKLTVSEFPEVAVLKEDKELRPILENGRILSENKTEIPPNQLILIGFQEGAILNMLLTDYPKILPAIRENIQEIQASPTKHNKYHITLMMKDGNKVYASTTDLLTKINYYPKVASSMEAQGIIDMEAGIYSYSYETLQKREQEEKEAKEREEWLKQLEKENAEKINE